MGGVKYMMSERALGKAAVIQGAVEGHYTVKAAAAKLRISERQVQRLKKAHRERGVEAFVHSNSDRHPANYRQDELRERIITLKKSDDYADTNFIHFKELLLEREKIEISYGALSTLLKNAGIGVEMQEARRRQALQTAGTKRPPGRTPPGRCFQLRLV
jgi:transposase